jgi:hypothetical protein
MDDILRTYDEKYTDNYGQERTFRVNIIADLDADAPWESEDGHGHGPVTDWVRREATSSEWLLNSDRGEYRYYNRVEAKKQAALEGWSGCGDTRDEQLDDAVYKDYADLKAWCNDEWRYVGIEVYPLTKNGDELKSKAESIWGIESDNTDHIKHIVEELMNSISEVLPEEI